jgi:DNA-directed RNA polymerase beta' subunit
MVTVRFGTPEEIRAASRGEVTEQELLDWQTLRPLADGLFCEAIFGPFDDKGSPGSPREERAGHVELVVPVCHYQYVAGQPGLLARACGLAQETLEDLVYYRDSGEGAPPAYCATAEVRRLLERAGAAGELEEALLQCLPVVPPQRRPLVMLEDGKCRVHHVNDLYRRVINRNNRLRKLLDLGAPPPIVRLEAGRLQQATDALIGNRRLPEPLLDRDDRPMHSLADLVGA